MADDDLIATVHDARADRGGPADGRRPGPGEELRGLGTDDNPVFPGMHEAAAHVVGASVEAFRQVWSGETLHSANITGGLHHAMPDRASGFCIYNDVAVGIQWLLDQGAERVAYVDVDVHHGDGVEADLLRRPAGADHLPARVRADAVPRHRLRRGHRRPGRARVRRSTSRCRPAPATPAGCAPSTPSCRRWCGSSRRTCWSPSTAATPTPRTRWPT